MGGGNGDTFTANGGNDIILAGGGNDIVYGGNGDDIIVGGSGSDTLWGNAGADHFRYTATGDGGANFSQAGADLIKDFNMAEGDVIEISASAFGGGLVAGNDATGIFSSSANNNFDANERLHFNTATHTLLYDSTEAAPRERRSRSLFLRTQPWTPHISRSWRNGILPKETGPPRSSAGSYFSARA